MSEASAARSKLRVICGMVLLSLGFVLVITWMVWVRTLHRSMLFDEAVLFGRNSPSWWEAKHRAAKVQWQHDDFQNVGYYATKEDLPWIIQSGPGGAAFGDCRGGHRSAALENITNQSADSRTKEAWEQWWKEHQHQSQGRWILEGFVKQGVQVSFPMDRRMELALLQTIGRYTRSHTDRTEHEDRMQHVRHNALRLLRDVEFDPAGVTVQELTEDTTGDLMKGLVALSGWQYAHPVRNGVGVVFVGEEKIRPIRFLPVVPWIPSIWLGVAGVCVLGGWRLARGRRSVTGAAEPHQSPAHLPF